MVIKGWEFLKKEKAKEAQTFAPMNLKKAVSIRHFPECKNDCANSYALVKA
jgi:hypothetical protein